MVEPALGPMLPRGLFLAQFIFLNCLDFPPDKPGKHKVNCSYSFPEPGTAVHGLPEARDTDTDPPATACQNPARMES